MVDFSSSATKGRGIVVRSGFEMKRILTNKNSIELPKKPEVNPVHMSFWFYILDEERFREDRDIS